jgi:hypothetical protein
MHGAAVPSTDVSMSKDTVRCREYEQLIPETWHIVHDADVVPRMGKFFRMYNRPGARVIIDRKGSIVVRPSPLELHLWPSTILTTIPFVACFFIVTSISS